MKLLLDTQVFVWLIDDDGRLGTRAARRISDTNNRVFLSYFSLFEITIKAAAGKMSYDHSIVNDLPAMSIELIMPSIDVLHGYQIVNPVNKDPFDNMLISVAKAEKCTFVTSDQKILSYTTSEPRLLDAKT